MKLVRRRITVTIALGEGTFGETGQNTITVENLRVAALIAKFGAPSFNTATLRIYGMPLSLMNQITTLWVPIPEFRMNSVTITAGDDEAGMAVAFTGGIRTAVVNLGAPPDSSLDIEALAAYPNAMKPVPPSTFTGPTDVAVIMSGLAAQMGYNFENNGVQGILLSNPYFPGTLTQQAMRAAEAAGINILFDDAVDGSSLQTLAIWPKNGSRRGSAAIISARTGMIGYPAYNGSGISVRTVYNPSLKFGGAFRILSDIAAATAAGEVNPGTQTPSPVKQGTWFIWGLTHNLASETPGGPWFSDVAGKTLVL